MKLDVYDTANSTFLGTLSEVHDVTFVDDLLIPGMARFQVDAASSSDLALLQPRRIVRFRTGPTPGVGDVFAAVVQDRPAELGSDIEPEPGSSVTTVTFECPGLLSWVGYQAGGAVLYPYGGLEGRQQNPRVFGWYTADFDDSDWEQVGPGMVDGKISTAGWPDPRAVAYRNRNGSERTIYRRSLKGGAGVAGPARMYVAANWRTAVEVWLDGEKVLEKPADETGLFAVDVDYEELDHQLAVVVEGGIGRWAFTWVSLVPTDSAARLDWHQTWFDDSGWSAPTAAGPIHTDGWPDPQAVAYEASGDAVRYRRRTAGAAPAQPGRLSVAAQWQTGVTVYLDGRRVLSKPVGGTGVFAANVAYPGPGHQLAVEVEGGGRWALSWVDSNGLPLVRTYDPGSTSPTNPWLSSRAPTEEPETQVGDVLRRTYDPDEFPDADPWLVFDGGPTDWTLPGFDDDGWNPPLQAGPLSTEGWPDSGAVALSAPPGLARFRYKGAFEVPSGTTRLYVAAQWQTSVRVFLDGDQVLAKPAGQSGLVATDVTRSASQVAVLVSGGGRWGLTWQQLGAGDQPAGPIVRTGPGWLASVEGPPGVTVGYVLDTALTEDAQRHSRPWTWTFDGRRDSDNRPWQVTFSRGFRMQQVGELIDELTSIEGEPHMTPAGELRYFVRRGTDRRDTVTLSAPYALGLSGRGPQATRWLYETEGGFGVAVNEQAEAEFGVLEQYVQLGTDVNPDGIGRALQRQLAQDGAVLDEVEVDLPGEVTPYVDIELGDTVTLVGRDGPAPVRVTSIEYSQDEAGNPVWAITATPDLEVL